MSGAALKAARVAVSVMMAMSAFAGAVLLVFWGAHRLFGAWGPGVLIGLMWFGIFWICAYLDIRGKEGRK